MRTDQALARFDFHQTRIRAAIAEGLVLLDGDPAEAQARLARSRWQLARLLREYQVFKHTEIFEPAIRSGLPIRAQRARHMAMMCVAAGESFGKHVTHWAGQNAAADWRRSRAAALEMAGQLQRALAGERKGVVELLTDGSPTRQPPG